MKVILVLGDAQKNEDPQHPARKSLFTADLLGLSFPRDRGLLS